MDKPPAIAENMGRASSPEGAAGPERHEISFHPPATGQPVMICRFSRDWRIISANQAFSTNYGIQPETGADLLSMIPEEKRSLMKARLSALSKDCPSVAYEHRIRGEDGSIRRRWNCHAIFDHYDEIVEYQAVGRDVPAAPEHDGLKRSDDRVHDLIAGIVQSLATIVELRDPYTAGHQKRVSALASEIAKAMGISANRAEGLRQAAYVHDVGKILIPSEILSKPGSLTAAEFDIIKSHPGLSYEILKYLDFPWPVAKIALQHHERIDGSGYPIGLKGDEILLEARILSVADVVETMSSHRPYRPAHSVEKALEEVETKSGTAFDPEAVAACLGIFREKGFIFHGQEPAAAPQGLPVVQP